MFSVSIVLYNHRLEDLRELLDVFVKSMVVGRVWLVDNGGSSWAESLAASVPKLVYIKSLRNAGYGSGHNQAIFSESGDFFYHIVSNPDVHLRVHDLELLHALVMERGDAILIPNIIFPSGERQCAAKLLPNPFNLIFRRFFPLLGRLLDRKYLLKDADYSAEFFAPSLSGCFMVCRHDALIRLGGFDERYFMYLEDIDLSRRLAALGGARFLPQVTVEHDFNRESYRNPRLLRAHMKSAFQYFNKWGWIFDEGRRSLNLKCLRELPKVVY